MSCFPHLSILPSVWTPFNPPSTPPLQVYLYLCPSLSKPKTSWPSPKTPAPSLLRDSPLHLASLLLLLQPLFPFFLVSSVSAAVAQHRNKVQPAVTAKCSAEKSFLIGVFFSFFPPTHTSLYLAFFSSYTHTQPALSPFCTDVAFHSVSCFYLFLSHFPSLYLSFWSLSLPSSFLSLSLQLNPACKALLHGC